VQGFFLNGVQVTGYALIAHVYPTEVRTTGVGTGLAVGRAGGIFSAFIGPALLGGTGRSFFIALAAIMTVVALGLLMIRRHPPFGRKRELCASARWSAWIVTERKCIWPPPSMMKGDRSLQASGKPIWRQLSEIPTAV
jgi:MFS family permease